MITTDANAALVAVQSIANEAYGKMAIDDPVADLPDTTKVTDDLWNTGGTVVKLSGIKNDAATFQVSFSDKANISEFIYKESGKVATWDADTGNWTVAEA